MKHFLDLSSWPTKELWHILQLAIFLKTEWQSGGNRPVLKDKLLGMVFQKPSLRTRVSFLVAMKQLGGDGITLGPDEIGLGTRESVPDTARVLSGYVQGIMARVFDHKHVEDLAAHASVPVINGLSDDEHPCQVMGDMLTILEHFGQLNELKLAYVGDGNNVAASLLAAAAHFGMHFAIATPPQYALAPKVLNRAAERARQTGAVIETFHDPKLAAEKAHVLYTDTWVSMGQEAETKERIDIMRPFQLNNDLVKLADKDCIVMHCLPAHRGQEITDEVADGPHSMIFPQAENRLHVQKAILVKLMA